MSFSRLSTGRSRSSMHTMEFACELGSKVGGVVAITRAPLARTMSGNVVDPVASLAEVPLNHSGAPPSRRSKRTMSQIRRACPPDVELKRRIRKVLLADPDMRFGSAVTMETRQRCMKQLEEDCGCSLKHKTGFIHKELERISLGSSTNGARAGRRQAPSVSEASLLSELKSKLEGKSSNVIAQSEVAAETSEKQPELQEGQIEDEAIPLGRTTSELEQQLRDALDSAQDVLQHDDEAFDTTIPTDVQQQDLPDLISPDPRPDHEEQGGDESYVTVTSEEVENACGDLLKEAETQNDATTTLHLSCTTAASSEQSRPDAPSPIDQLSALRKRLHQIRSVVGPEDTPDRCPAEVVVNTVTSAEDEADSESAPKGQPAESEQAGGASPTVNTAAAINDVAEVQVELDSDAKTEGEAVETVSPVVTEAESSPEAADEVSLHETASQVAELAEVTDTTATNKTDVYRAELEQMSRKQLQSLAKAHGIKANISSSKIIDALCAL